MQGLTTSHVHHPVYKPSLNEKNNSIIIPYTKTERPTDKLCMGHIPVVEILPSGEQQALLPQSAALREELFSLHREVTFISSSGLNTEQALAEAWSSSPNIALPEDGLIVHKRQTAVQVSHLSLLKGSYN